MTEPKTIQTRFAGKTMNAVLTPAIITENALQAEEILSAPDIARPEQVLPDASDLNHISGAGLRSVLRLLKQYPRLSMIDVSPEAYEIMDVTGFTAMLTVERRLQQVSTEGCPIIGKGKNGCVYRLSPDTIVKVYNEKNTLDNIRREQKMARFGFISGIPTAIPFQHRPYLRTIRNRVRNADRSITGAGDPGKSR